MWTRDAEGTGQRTVDHNGQVDTRGRAAAERLKHTRHFVEGLAVHGDATRDPVLERLPMPTHGLRAQVRLCCEASTRKSQLDYHRIPLWIQPHTVD